MPLDQIDVDNDTYEVKKNDDMSFWDHLDELRRRLFRALIAVTVGVIGVFALGDWVFTSIIYGPKEDWFVTYKFMHYLANQTGVETLRIQAPKLQLITVGLGEVFFKQMQVAIVMGIMCAAPVIFWQVWLFIKPGLLEREVKAARGFVSICSALFVMGVLFGYFVIAPFAISFLANYTIGGIGGTATLDDYVGLLVMFTLPIGLIFELPVIIYFLARIGIVSGTMLRGYRKQMVVILLIIAGIITPSPDIMSQFLVGLPLYLLYEIGIIVADRVQKRRAAEA